MPYLGEMAAIATALTFTVSSLQFSLAGRETSSGIVNHARVLIGLVFVVAIHWVMTGTGLPLDQPLRLWAIMAVSGLIGFVFGDLCLFEAFVLVGARLSMLIFSLAPIVAALVSWLFLDESLVAHQWAGIVITVSGIALVIQEKNQPLAAAENRRRFRGVLFAIGAAAGQALGLVVAKLALADGCPPLSGNVMRLCAATLALWGVATLRGRVRYVVRAMASHPTALRRTFVGAFVGTAIGVWLSLIAIERAPVGIASTLMSLTPVFLIPVSRFLGETVSWQAVWGTLVAMAGTALLFL